VGKVVRKFFLWAAVSVAAVAALPLWVWWQDVATDRRYKLEVIEPITLLARPPQAYPEANTSVGEVLPGETITVLRMGYGKDFRAWRVRGAKNQVGWFVEDGKNVRVKQD
jgi:hypothetical protein